MKLRFDLVEKLTPEMLLKSVLANNHRYKAEPLLSKNWDWELVVHLNRGACTEENAQCGDNQETV